MKPSTDILVIGAGMTGLAAARDLVDQGHQVLVLDKGRGLGGRLAGKRFGDAVFDNGAQQVTARTPRFLDLIQRWAANGHVTPWDLSLGDSSEQIVRWRGTPAMTALAKQLGAGLPIQQSAQVSSIARKGDRWECTLHTGVSIQADAIVITIPVPQALDLFSAGDLRLEKALHDQLAGIEYHRCVSVMAVLTGPSNLPLSGGLSIPEGPISWIADNQRKGISDQPAVTIHASPEFSLTHWDGDREETARELLRLAAPWLGAGVDAYRIHGWKFSMPVSVQEEDYVRLHDQPAMILAGDAFGGGRVEGAVLSGWAAARALGELYAGDKWAEVNPHNLPFS